MENPFAEKPTKTKEEKTDTKEPKPARATKKKTKKNGPKKAQDRGNRQARLHPSERKRILKAVKEYFGASKVETILATAGTQIKDWEPTLKQLKKKMEQELEDAERDVVEYYQEIDKDYKSVGRPVSVFNEKELRYLISIQCTPDEIAGFFQMNKKVLFEKVKDEYGITWTEFYERNSQGVKVSLRRRQVKAAMEGDTKMLVFLGKNILGQKEKIDFDGEVKVNSWVDLMSNLEKKEEKE